MKRILSAILLVLGFWSASSSLAAEDEGRQLVIRMYIAGGQTIDLDASEVDSITATTEVQQIWSSGTCDVIPLVSIDSICYMYPSLVVSEREVNFGKVQVGNGKTYSLCLTNTSAYPETYTVTTAGAFTVANAGQEIVIGPEDAVDVEVSFDPASATSYGGSLVVTSASIAGGELSVPLKGIGVETAEEEEPYIIPPTETEFLVEVPEDMDVEQLAGFKIVNSYGEFPLVVSAKTRKMARTKSGRWGISVTCKYSLNGLQCNFLMDFNNNPYGFTISFPGEQPVMSAEETAIALLMADPLMITDSKTEYHNTVKVIKHLDNYGEYLEKVKDLYDKGTKQMMCPDYSQIDASRVIFELLAKTRDNSELELDGMSLVDVQRLNNSIKYKIRNSRKRILHAYPSRVIMNEGNVTIESQQEDTHTMTEFMEEMMENADIIGEYFDDEDKATIVDLKEWIGEIEEFLISMGLGEKDSHIQLPIVLEPGTANYWKIVKGTYQGERGSVFEIVSDEIESSLVDEGDPSLIYDKLYIDIYGMGLWDQGFSALRKKDLLRIFFAMVHGAYNDVVQPMLNVAAGWKDLKESSGSDDYRYDFRYGKRKWPELALCSKLLYDFAYTGELARMTADAYTGTKSVWDYVKQMAVFAYNRILTCPSDDTNDDKRTYTNLIYNIYKKYSGISSTSKEFRDNFKAVANNLTHMKKISFAGKVIKFGETAVDLAGGVDAILRSSMKQTFIIDRFDEPTIQIIAPADVYKKMPETVHLEWETFKGDRFGDFVYDLTLFVEDAEKGVYVNIFNNYHDTQYDLNLNRIPEAKNAGRIRFQIVAHHPEYPEVIYSKTDFLSLLDISLDYDIKFIDLGLPSGTLWADRNLGAKAVEDYGNYYAWGETTGFDEGKSTFSWSNYKYCHGSANTLTKYCSKSSYGYRNFTDALTELEGTDDAASSAYVSRSYHIPTKEDWEELIRECNWRWFTWGMMVYGPNGNIISLHNAGYRHGMTLLESGSEGHYWSSTLDVNSPDDAWYLYFSGRSYEKYDYYRSEGRSIRPVYRDGMIAAPKRVPEATQAIESLEKHPQEGVVIKMVSGSK